MYIEIVCAVFESAWYDPLSAYNSLHIEARAVVKKRRRIMREESHLYNQQPEDFVNWGATKIMGDTLVGVGEKLPTLDDQRIKCGLKPLGSATGNGA